jgi:hypothetical protein
MNTRHLKTVAAAAAVMGLAFTAGCSGDNDQVATSTAGTVTSTPTPFTTPLTPEEQAIADAEEAVREYFRVWNEAHKDTTWSDINRLESVATDTALSDFHLSLNSMDDQKAHQVGDLKVDWIELAPEGVGLTDNQTISPPEVPSVELRVCYDVSEVDVVTDDGASIVQPGRMDRVVLHASVYNYEYPDGPWRVGSAKMTEETC